MAKGGYPMGNTGTHDDNNYCDQTICAVFTMGFVLGGFILSGITITFTIALNNDYCDA